MAISIKFFQPKNEQYITGHSPLYTEEVDTIYMCNKILHTVTTCECSAFSQM